MYLDNYEQQDSHITSYTINIKIQVLAGNSKIKLEKGNKPVPLDYSCCEENESAGGAELNETYYCRFLLINVQVPACMLMFSLTIIKRQHLIHQQSIIFFI